MDKYTTIYKQNQQNYPISPCAGISTNVQAVTANDANILPYTAMGQIYIRIHRYTVMDINTSHIQP